MDQLPDWLGFLLRGLARRCQVSDLSLPSENDCPTRSSRFSVFLSKAISSNYNLTNVTKDSVFQNQDDWQTIVFPTDLNVAGASSPLQAVSMLLQLREEVGGGGKEEVRRREVPVHLHSFLPQMAALGFPPVIIVSASDEEPETGDMEQVSIRHPHILISSCFPVFISSCFPVFLSSCLPVFLSSCLPVFLSSCLPVFLPPVFLSSCLPVFLSSCLVKCSAHAFFE